MSFLQHAVVAHDPESGAPLWRDDWDGHGYAQNSAAPLYEEPYLYCSAPFRQGARTLKLVYENDQAKALPVWQSKVLCHDILSPVVVDGYIYGFDVQDAETRLNGGTKGEFKCVELATGLPRWASKAPGHASVLRCADKLLLLNESGQLIVIAASPERYQELYRTRVINGKTPCWTAPAYYKNRLLIRNRQNLVCYYVGPAQEAPPIAAPIIPPIDSLSVALAQEWLSWSETHQSPCFWRPEFRDLLGWYGWSLGVLALAAGLTSLTRGKPDRTTVLLILTTVLGFLSMPLVSYAFNSLIFTWPATCFAAFLLTAARRNVPGNRPVMTSAILTRLRLVTFAGFCLGYVILCHYLLIYSGIGFLMGFIAVLPFLRMRQTGCGTGKVDGDRILCQFGVSFSVYYWSSAGFILWATRSGG